MGNNNHYFLLSVTITISIIIHHLLEFSSIYSIRHHPIGLATVFNAPIGGLLFSIEVTSTYYLISNYWKSFMAAVAGGDIMVVLVMMVIVMMVMVKMMMMMMVTVIMINDVSNDNNDN